jgi:hypothetical protein
MTKQSVKQFLKLDWGKIVITILIIVVSLFDIFLFLANIRLPIFYGSNVDFYTVAKGFPLPFVVINMAGRTPVDFSIFYPGLVTDLILWYLVSCLIIFIWNKFKKKKTI